jgi:hypothetical protein
MSWRQHRLELVLIATLGLCLTGAMAMANVQMRAAFMEVLKTCDNDSGQLCVSTSVNFSSQFGTMATAFEAAMLALPGLAGMFIGAPLMAREFEQGTARLVWTQGITRRRWLATKLGVILAVAVVATGALGIAGSLLTPAPIGMFVSRWTAFDLQGPVMVAYVIFAMTLGAAAGAFIRRSVPAIAVTLVLFVAIRIAVYAQVRRQYLPPLEIDESQVADAGPGSWFLGQRAVDMSGHPVSNQYYQQLMANAGAVPGSLGDYMRAHGVVVLQAYQPESRFWLFQGMEAGLFVALAVGLMVLLIWSTRRA